MKSLLTLPLTALALCSTVVVPATAQTCRVSAGVSADGRKIYREVFEYDYVNDKPVFPGGDSGIVDFINSHRSYPADAYRRGVEGRVICSFVVNADGAVSHLRVVKGVEQSLNDEALRILSLMPAWTPGRLNGRPVPVRVICTVPFRK